MLMDLQTNSSKYFFTISVGEDQNSMLGEFV